jgi:hypothetical protein
LTEAVHCRPIARSLLIYGAFNSDLMILSVFTDSKGVSALPALLLVAVYELPSIFESHELISKSELELNTGC